MYILNILFKSLPKIYPLFSVVPLNDGDLTHIYYALGSKLSCTPLLCFKCSKYIPSVSLPTIIPVTTQDQFVQAICTFFVQRELMLQLVSDRWQVKGRIFCSFNVAHFFAMVQKIPAPELNASLLKNNVMKKVFALRARVSYYQYDHKLKNFNNLIQLRSIILTSQSR